MRKALVFTLPARGHINPTQMLMRELTARGDDVTAVSFAMYRDGIEASGARFVGYPQDESLPAWQAAEAGSDRADLAIVAPALMAVSRAWAPWCRDLVTQTQPDYVLFDAMAPWGELAARVSKRPNISMFTTFAINNAVAAAEMRKRAAARLVLPLLRVLPGYWRQWWALWRSVGAIQLLPWRILMTAGELNLVFTTRAQQPAAHLLDRSYHFVGPLIAPPPPMPPFPYHTLTRKPVVYIAMGTVVNIGAAFFRTCFAAFADHPGQFVVSVGTRTDRADLGEIPANVSVYARVPQVDLLHHVDAFITHGGQNSVNEAMLAGVPLVVVPQQVEQDMVGRRIAQRGAGEVIPAVVLGQPVTAAALRTTLDTVLGSPGYRSAANATGDALRRAGGAAAAADAIDAFLQNRNAPLG